MTPFGNFKLNLNKIQVKTPVQPRFIYTITFSLCHQYSLLFTKIFNVKFLYNEPKCVCLARLLQLGIVHPKFLILALNKVVIFVFL